MKIGILTLPLIDNYGGILQAMALYRFLHLEGHEVVLIQKHTHIALWKKITIGILKKIPFHNFKGIKTTKNEQVLKERKKLHTFFMDKEIFSKSKDLYTDKDLEDFAKKEKFDAVIVGSDQVWRKAYINDKYYKSYFLDFIDNKKTKKIAYAASFGKDYWEGKSDIEEISSLLKEFYAISTRESSGVEICRNTFGFNDAKHVLDPTLLMNKEFYMNEIISKYDVSSITKGGLTTYVLDEAYEKAEVIGYAKSALDIKEVNHLKGFKHSGSTYTIPQWLASFAYADFVVTDSFHGMLFSILFEKNFLVIGNEGRGMERFTSLLSLLGLKDKLVLAHQDLKNINLDNINYDVVNKILDEQRKKSVDFLKNNLKVEKCL
jgi:hypothetical protein